MPHVVARGGERSVRRETSSRQPHRVARFSDPERWDSPHRVTENTPDIFAIQLAAFAQSEYRTLSPTTDAE